MTWAVRPGIIWAVRGSRLLVAAGLAVDAYVQVDLAGLYAEGGGQLNEGLLFRAEAVVAALALLAVLITGRRVVLAAALVISATALAAMLVSRYADLGPLGPFPDLYDPVWYPEKAVAAAGEAVAALAAATGLLFPRRR